MADLPPLPPGFTLDAQPKVPPLPPGFTLDSAPAQKSSVPPESSVGRDLSLGARAAGEGVASVGTALGDLTMNSPVAQMIPASPTAMIGSGVQQATGHTPAFWAVKAFNKLAGTNLPETETFQGIIENALTQAGAPTPQTSNEKLGSAAVKGTAAALTGSLGAGVTGAGNMIRAGLSGASGGTAAEVAKQSGAGPLGQMAAGTIGGMVPGVIEGSARLAGQVVQGAVRPLTRTGQETAAAQLMQENATDPQQAAANLDQAQSIVPGSQRTTGEASKDVGLLALEKGVRGKNTAAFGTRLSEQNAARQNELGALAGSEGDIAFAKDARSAITGPMREQALNDANSNTIKLQSLTDEIANRFQSKASALQDKGRFDTAESQARTVADQPYLAVSGQARVPGRLSPQADRMAEAAGASADMQPIIAQRQAELEAAQTQLAQLKASGASALEIGKVTNRVNGILRTPGLRASQVVQKAMTAVSDKLGSLADENGVIDARDLYTVRKELGTYIETAAKESSNWDKRLTASLQTDVQHSIDDAIEGAAPGFKAYLSRYSDMSKPIDQMKIIQEIERRSTLSGMDTSTGQQFLGSASFGKALDTALRENPDVLTPDQVSRLKAIRTDLQYGQAINSSLIKAPGSDTYQNLSIAQVIGAGPKGAHPVFKVLTTPLKWLYKAAGSDEKISQILADAMLDPKLAASMLKRATPSTMAHFSGQLRQNLGTSALATANVVAGQRPSQAEVSDSTR